jgi:two-component system nitrogen regulation sensor histidine kinase NtrY
VQVVEEEGDDEIAMLGRLFNQMTRQLKGQREALIDSHRQTEQRRRLFDSVLSNVTAGVIGLDAEGGSISSTAPPSGFWTCRARCMMCRWPRRCPSSAPLLDRLRDGTAGRRAGRGPPDPRGKLESLLVRMSERRNERRRAGRLCRGLRRRDRSGHGAAHGRLGRRGPPHRA